MECSPCVTARFSSLVRVVLAILPTLPITAGAATVILEFEESSVPPQGTQPGIDTYAEDGFTIEPFNAGAGGPPFRLRRNGGSNPGFPENGSPYLQLATNDSMRMTLSGGQRFTPVSVDLAEFSTGLLGVNVMVTFNGFFADNSSVTTTFALDGVIDGTDPLVDFENFTFPSSFADIVRLESGVINAPSGAFSLDNFTVIPEPALPLLAMLGIGLSCRRRMSVSDRAA